MEPDEERIRYMGITYGEMYVRRARQIRGILLRIRMVCPRETACIGCVGLRDRITDLFADINANHESPNINSRPSIAKIKNRLLHITYGPIDNDCDHCNKIHGRIAELKNSL